MLAESLGPSVLPTELFVPVDIVEFWTGLAQNSVDWRQTEWRGIARFAWIPLIAKNLTAVACIRRVCLVFVGVKPLAVEADLGGNSRWIGPRVTVRE